MTKIEILFEEKKGFIETTIKGMRKNESLREQASCNVIINLVETFINDKHSGKIFSAELLKLKLEKELK